MLDIISVQKIDPLGLIFSAQGNKYLVIKSETLILNPSWVKRVCLDEEIDGITVLRNISILPKGSDGKYAKAEFLIYNSDGSYSLISGNGLASGAAFIFKRYDFKGEPLLFYNDYVESTVIPDREGGFYVGFRITNFTSELSISFTSIADKGYYLEMPNEHLVIPIEDNDTDISEIDLPEVASKIREELNIDANISIFKPILEEPFHAGDELRPILLTSKYQARVWERGVGETGSCGSAAAAMTNLLVLLGANSPEYKFYMPGGVIKTLFSEPVVYIQSKPKLLREKRFR